MKRNYPFLPCSVFCKGAEKKNGFESMAIYSNSGCILYPYKMEKRGKKGKKN